MDFCIAPIDDEIFARIDGKSYKKNCPVPRETLRYLRVLHRDLQGVTREGELICNELIAEAALDIFKRLFEANYPIEKVRLVDEYDANDELSMRDNNSSGFNFRLISYTNEISKHGLGLAIDINPLYNPYVKYVDGRLNVEPSTGTPYLDRSKDFPYKITRDDLCCRLFLEHGFEWGGDLIGRKDWQHFEMPDAVTQKFLQSLDMTK